MKQKKKKVPGDPERKVQLRPQEAPGRRPRAWRRSGGPHRTGQDVQVRTLTPTSPDTSIRPPPTVLRLTPLFIPPIPSLSPTLWWRDPENDLSCSGDANICITCWLTQPENITGFHTRLVRQLHSVLFGIFHWSSRNVPKIETGKGNKRKGSKDKEMGLKTKAGENC